ncbi:Uncharacterized protein T10_5120 [Trichinella papuae]|uniref:Zinc finger BED domain-containing protein 5 n=1 Tax=Trichinella papuae TaxID=268474 RepID=A0A0V1M337_9BILA|nr:Uncharacterized protein T10_5120 [Trichinella papuae]
MAKKAQSYTIGEEIIIPAIKEVIETVMKKDSEPVLKCIPLTAKTVQRRIDEMASDVEKTLMSELQHCKFSIQLDESAFGCSNILMAYVMYYCQSLILSQPVLHICNTGFLSALCSKLQGKLNQFFMIV